MQATLSNECPARPIVPPCTCTPSLPCPFLRASLPRYAPPLAPHPDPTSHPLPFTVDSVRFHHAWIRTRFPFRYGIASMTQAPHVLAEVSVTCANRSWTGLSA